MRIGFEEKTYENYFNAELDRRSRIFFPPGQVQEGLLGFDSSADSRNRFLWRRLGYPFWFFPHFSGIELREIARDLESWLNVVIDDIPQIRANLIFQYKKPEFMITANSKEWQYWNEPYYRYNIYQSQQSILNRIDSHFGNQILVIYASPKARNINELVKLKTSRNVINASNFKKASDLNGHHRNTYISSGTFSIACSEPERIDDLDLLQELEIIGNDSKQELPNRQFIINFSNEIKKIISEDKYYGEPFLELLEDSYSFKNYELIEGFKIMNIFKQITGLQWLMKI